MGVVPIIFISTLCTVLSVYNINGVRGASISNLTHVDNIKEINGSNYTGSENYPGLQHQLILNYGGNETKRLIEKRDASYEETFKKPQPMAVAKRSAIVLNKLIYALRNSIANMEAADEMDKLGYGNDPEGLYRRNMDSTVQHKMHEPRRGQKDGRTYFRCYFNAVSCFRKKRQ